MSAFEKIFNLSIYLVEKDCPAKQAITEYINDYIKHIDEWGDWLKSVGIDDAELGVYSDGHIAGVKIKDVPKGWKKHDVHGYTMPKAKNLICKTMPKLKLNKKPHEYLADVGIHVPTDVVIRKKDGEIVSRWGMGHWFKPVQFLYFTSEDDGLYAIALPNYESELNDAQLRLSELGGHEQCTIEPALDFDYVNLLEGCRMIPEYEWNYLVGKFKEKRGTK